MLNCYQEVLLAARFDVINILHGIGASIAYFSDW